MPLVYADMKLCDIILHEPTLIPVLNRFGITLGIGDKSIRSVCEENSLDTDFFLTILNTFINEEFFPENRLKTFCATQIVDYLTKTNIYYECSQLHNIERHFNSLIQHSGTSGNNLELIHQFFLKVKNELLSRIEHDRAVWFPEIKLLSEKIGNQRPDGIKLPTKGSYDEQNSLEEKLHDLTSLFVMHLSGTIDPNLCYGVIFAIYTLEKDIKQHNRIRNRILLPMNEAMKRGKNDN